MAPALGRRYSARDFPPRRDRLPRDRRLPDVHRLPWSGEVERVEAATASELARDPLLAQVEAALFAADEPLTSRRLAQAAGLADAAAARRLVRKLQALYDQDGTAFQVQELAGGYQLLTRTQFHPWLVRLRRTGNEMRLTAAMRETLAIVAYRQPIMRADIEAIRGVHCGEVLRQLIEKGLIRIAGRDSSLGRPVLYGTTRRFLQIFGLQSLRDLPMFDQLHQPPKRAGERGPEPPSHGPHPDG
jgi:segregation and condensation protein B